MLSWKALVLFAILLWRVNLYGVRRLSEQS